MQATWLLSVAAVKFGIVLGAVAVLAVLAFVFGAGLAAASRVFHVEVDPRVEEIEAALPGVNCGACGYAGCADYAAAVAAGKAGPSLCIPGGMEAARKIAAVMGLEAEETEPLKAVLVCQGRQVPARIEYRGVADCRAAALIAGGERACPYACIGLGTCAEVCPVGAIRMDADRLPVIDEEACIGCGACAKVCPQQVIEVQPVSKTVHVRCRSRDKGAVVRRICPVGCIACRKCEKICPFDAIHVVDNLAVIDYSKCTSCEKCVGVCPTGTIASFLKARRARARSARAGASVEEAGSP